MEVNVFEGRRARVERQHRSIIDTERFQDGENNVLDTESEIRYPKNHKHSKKKLQTKVVNLISFFKGALLGSTALKTSIFSMILGALCAITRVLLRFEVGR